MNKFIKSTLILIFGGFITKILGMVIKIVMTRYIGIEGISLYMLIMPTFSLFIGLCQFGMPIAVTKIVSENKSNNKNIILISIILSLIIDIILMLIIIICSKFISINLLNDYRTYYPLLAISLTLPFISISSIIRSYFFGKQKVLPHVLSNIIEDIVRLIIIIIGVPIFLTKGIIFTVCFLVLSNIISELVSIFVLYLFLPKKININKNDFNFKNIKKITNISLPTVSTRLIGNIGYFFEPIIITNVLLYIGYSNNFIVKEYGIISGYVIPLLTLPSFFMNAISSTLLPVISNDITRGNKINKRIKQGIIFSLLIGIPCTIIFIVFPKQLLCFIYNTNLGSNYIRFLAPIFLLLYIQGPLTSVLQAVGLSKKAMMGSLIGILIRTTLLFILSLLKIGLWSLIIAIAFNIIYTTIHHIIVLKKEGLFC